MRIRWERILALPILVVVIILAIKVIGIASNLFHNFFENIKWGQSKTWSGESVVIVLAGFLLITFIAALKLIVQSKQNDRHRHDNWRPFE